MTQNESRRILKSVIPANSARLEGEFEDVHGGGSIYWLPHQYTSLVDGNLTADQHEAIAVYMRDNYEPKDQGT